MKRIVFLDYVRVFACFLVMVVHASENFYGAPGSTDMAGPQSYLATEAARYRRRSYGCRGCVDHLLFLLPGYPRRNPPYACDRNRMGFLYHQLRVAHGGYLPSFYVYRGL